MARRTTLPASRALQRDQCAERICNTILSWTVPHDTAGLERHISSELTTYGGWDQWLAEGVLNRLRDMIENVDHSAWGEGFRVAFAEAQKALAEVEGWAREHPLWASAIGFIVVFGVLELLCPWVLGALGFGELGPIAGSWAARWQSLYGGCVPKKSLFSYLQRLGMQARPKKI
ncbi:MAG: hypothetical protein LQ340_006104 [Diploschistes diacapsis]|nr:MAG: hypothetical protein LQ340_006104 [Diploschistes diacapsis]